MILHWCLWGLAVYGVTCLLLVILRKLNWIKIVPRQVHVVILSYNSQHSIEWTLRSLNMWSWLEGKAYNFTIIDAGSSDDTKMILSRLCRGYSNIRIIDTSLNEMEPTVKRVIDQTDQVRKRVVVMDLRKAEGIRRTLQGNVYTQ